MTPAIADAMRELERAWDEHQHALLVRRDLVALLATMADEPLVRHLPVGSGATGRDAVARFYGTAVLANLPGELAVTGISRTVGRFRLVDEVSVAFRHDRPVPWLLPGVAATHRRAEVTAVTVVDFRRLRICSLRTLWDHATLLDQLGLSGGFRPLGATARS